MGFREKLPANCPPADSHEQGCEQAFRFLPSNQPALEHFESNQAKDEPLPLGVDACRWAACSLFPDMETVQKKRKLKKLQSYPFVAQLKINSKSGRMIEASKHISFWMFDTFDPLAAIVQIQAL